MSKGRLYLLVVFGPDLQTEHRQIAKAVEYHSDGDFVEVDKQIAAVRGAKAAGQELPFSVAYLFTTAKPPGEMSFGTLDRDRYLLIEAGPNYWTEGLSVARLWLERHRTST